MAEVFKYKDENGRWQFSDTPVKQGDSTSVRSYGNSGLSNAQSTDFVTLLNSKYKPTNPVQEATMAVVTVKSKLGSGSGFFITGNCYLITNKHVVRPAKGKHWDAAQVKIKRNAIVLERNSQQISNQKERLAIDKQKLNNFWVYMKGLSSDKEKRLAQREYSFYLQQYNQDQRLFKEASKRLNEIERKFKQQQSDFNFSSAISNVAQSFEIILKDNTKTRANLVKVSPTDDLALLKVNGCKAPYLTLAVRHVSQGENVHAIGSPLGLRDQLTDGTVTQVSVQGIATDAQILPGNSGGPLVNNNGDVVAVNTLKVARGSALNRGFGISIPIARVSSNFGSYIR